MYDYELGLPISDQFVLFAPAAERISLCLDHKGMCCMQQIYSRFCLRSHLQRVRAAMHLFSVSQDFTSRALEGVNVYFLNKSAINHVFI